VVQSQFKKIVHKTLSRKYSSQKKGAGGMGQGVDSEFKPQYSQKKKLIY
jgi:hypothetical protein